MDVHVLALITTTLRRHRLLIPARQTQGISTSGHGFGTRGGLTTPSDMSDTSSVTSEAMGVGFPVNVHGRSFGVDKESPRLPMPPPAKPYEDEQLPSLLSSLPPGADFASGKKAPEEASKGGGSLGNSKRTSQSSNNAGDASPLGGGDYEVHPTDGTYSFAKEPSVLPIKVRPSTLEGLLQSASLPSREGPPLAPPPGGKPVSRDELREVRERLVEAEREVVALRRGVEVANSREEEQRRRADELELMIEGGEEVKPGQGNVIEELRLQVSRLEGQLSRLSQVRSEGEGINEEARKELKESRDDVVRLARELEEAREEGEGWKVENKALKGQNKKLLEEVAVLDKDLKSAGGGGKDVAAMRRKELALTQEITTLHQLLESSKTTEQQLESAKGVIAILEERQRELDGMLGGLQHERDHIDDVVSEMRKLRAQVPRPTDAQTHRSTHTHTHRVRESTEREYP